MKLPGPNQNPDIIKAVYDTNVVVSELLSRGAPYVCLILALTGKVQLYLSKPLLQEYEAVLNRPKFQSLKQDVPAFIATLQRNAVLIEPKRQIRQIQADLPDNRVLECAIEARVEFLVTGNKRHFNFEAFEGVKIVEPRELLKAVVPNILILL